MTQRVLKQVDYARLDEAKGRFIEASKRTLTFAGKYGSVVNPGLGASANVFALEKVTAPLAVTLVSEGLGTADDARPDDLSSAELVRFWNNIGIKTVSVMTNDAASAGLQPILLSLYLPSATPELVFNDEFLEGFLDGIVAGCSEVGCVYISGETPQLETKLVPGRLDIAGATFAICPQGSSPVSGVDLEPGDTIVFIQSSGPHENGYTALRKLAEKLPQGYRTKLPSGVEYWEALNAPSVLYTGLIQDLVTASIFISGIEPVTGHGWQKLMRSAKPYRYRIREMLPVPEVFRFVQEHSGSSAQEMMQVFNYGVGLTVFTRTHHDAELVVNFAKKRKLAACVAGTVEEAPAREVVVEPLGVTLSSEGYQLKR